MTRVWLGTRGVVKWLTSLSRNFFTDLRKTSEDCRSRGFLAQLVNLQTNCFLPFLFKKKKAWGRELNATVKGHSPI